MESTCVKIRDLVSKIKENSPVELIHEKKRIIDRLSFLENKRNETIKYIEV